MLGDTAWHTSSLNTLDGNFGDSSISLLEDILGGFDGPFLGGQRCREWSVGLEGSAGHERPGWDDASYQCHYGWLCLKLGNHTRQFNPSQMKVIQVSHQRTCGIVMCLCRDLDCCLGVGELWRLYIIATRSFLPMRALYVIPAKQAICMKASRHPSSPKRVSHASSVRVTSFLGHMQDWVHKRSSVGAWGFHLDPFWLADLHQPEM